MINDLTEEDFALFPVSRIQFRRRELWCAMFIVFGYGCVMNVAWHNDVPIARTVAMGYLIAALLFSLPCLFFTSKQSILQHKIAYLKCRSISLILFRLAFLQFFTIFSVCLYCDSWNHPDEGTCYHYKLFVRDKEEIYKDSAERGIGFIFVRLILLVIILLILYLAVNFIYAVRLFGWNKILNE